MNDDDRYLWDGSGTPDPEIERLERALEPLRAPVVGPALPLPARPRRWVMRVAMGVTAAGALAAAGTMLVMRGRGPGPDQGPLTEAVPHPAPAGSATGAPAGGPATEAPENTSGWPLQVLAGQPRIGGRVIAAQGRLQLGEVLETGSDGKAKLEVPALGSVEVEAYSRVQLVTADERQQRLRLHSGALEVSIYAPPGKFYVETPAGTVIDLGCAYSVNVDASGNGRLQVRTGWVGLRLGARESLLPAGAECSLRAGKGPGTPRLADASEYFRRAVTVLDGPSAQEEQAFALGTVLSQARPQDAFTLWHLLDRLPVESRPMVLRRLVQLVPAAGKVPRKRVLAGEQAARDRLWDQLGLDPISHWRRWSAELR